MTGITTPDSASPLVDPEGRATDEFQRYLDQVTQLDLIVGTGSPEGNIEANVGREYLDDAGAAGAVKFIKQLADIGGDKSQGWVAI